MSDPLRTDSSRAFDAASDSDRDAKIEQLLLIGLDHYFAAEYEQAINVWTRALFLDRSHAKARGYIERARSALAERQRESEELVQRGVSAFQRGENDEARNLLQTALHRGAPSEEAIAVLDRLNRLEASAWPQPAAGTAKTDQTRAQSSGRTARATGAPFRLLWVFAAAMSIAIIVVSQQVDWRSLLVLDSSPPLTLSTAPPDTPLPLPLRGETALRRARAFAARGRLREALVVLDEVKPTDSQKPEADQLRARIQRELIALTSNPPSPQEAQGKGDGPLP